LPEIFKLVNSLMDWLKNNHPAVIIVATYCLGFGIFVYAAFSQFVSWDSWWHLRMGQDLLFNGMSPRVDHYSFTFPGHPISSVPYPFQIVLAMFVSVFGEPEGFQALRMFAFTIFMVAIYFYYRKIKAPWQIIVITLPFIFIFLLFRYNHIRAEIFDSTLVIVALILYLRASQSFSHKNLAIIAVFQLFWVNYHAPLLGYVIFFGLFLDKAIELLSGRGGAVSWPRWAGWGLLLFLIGFANPDLEHQFISVLGFSQDWSMLTELVPTNEFVPNNPFFFVFWLVSAYIAVSLLMQRQFGLALVCAIFAFQSWQSINIITISGVVVSCLLAFTLTRVDFVALFETIKPGIRRLVLLAGVLVAVSGVVLALTRAVDVRKLDNSDSFPRDTAMYLKQNHPQGGNILNRLRDGGYLIYHLAPEFKVYIDGRTNILYPLEFLKDFVALYRAQNFRSIRDEIDRYNIEFALYPLAEGLFPLADPTQSMSAEFVSREFILLSTRKNNFPVSSRMLYFPMCWDKGEQRVLTAELAKARQILPEDSPLLPVLETLIAFNNSTDSGQFFNSVSPARTVSPYQRRLLGYIALDYGFYANAFDYFQSVGENSTQDLLMQAYAALQMRDFDRVDDVLLVVLSDAWVLLNNQVLSVSEKAIAVTLLERYKTQRPLPGNFENRRALLKSELKRSNPALQLPLSEVVLKGDCEPVFSSPNVASILTCCNLTYLLFRKYLIK